MRGSKSDLPWSTELSTEVSEYTSLDLLLKLSNSIQIDIIPGDVEASSNKTFEWQVAFFSDNNMYIDIFFDNPGLISTGADDPDMLSVTLSNMESFMYPVSEEKLNLEDGYKVQVKLPPQVAKELKEKKEET